MAKAKTIRVAQIEELGRALDALPKRPREAVGKEDAIRILARKIAEAQAKGHDLAAIVALFQDRGIAVSESVLRAHLRPKKRPIAKEVTAPKIEVDKAKNVQRDSAGDSGTFVAKEKV